MPDTIQSMRKEDNYCLAGRARRVPRGLKRREEIAGVAERVFLERGFTEATMQLIADRAGASKETLYRHFGNKDELFAEIVRRCASQITGERDGDLDWGGAPAEVLRRLGLNLLNFLLRPDSLSFYRIIVAESVRAPELGRIFYAQGPGHVRRKLADYLGAMSERGDLCCPAPELAAKLFLGAIVGNYRLAALVAPDAEPLDNETIGAHVDEAVQLFLARYGPAASRPCETRRT